MAGCTLQESARLGDLQIDPGMVEDSATEFAKTDPCQFCYPGIDFYRVDALCIMVECLQDSSTATGPQYQDPAGILQMVGQCGS